MDLHLKSATSKVLLYTVEKATSSIMTNFFSSLKETVDVDTYTFNLVDLTLLDVDWEVQWSLIEYISFELV